MVQPPRNTFPLAVSSKTKHTPTISASDHVPWHFPKGSENMWSYKNSPTSALVIIVRFGSYKDVTQVLAGKI